MATTLSTTVTSWRKVNGSNSPISGTGMVGWEPGPSRPSVARYQFTSPANGATSVSWRDTEINLTNYHYADDSTGHYKIYSRVCPHFNWIITTDPDAYKYYSGDAGYDCSYNQSDRYIYGSANINLLPNTTYYMFVYPDVYYQSYYAIFAMNTVTMTVDGAYGTSNITATNGYIGSSSTLSISRYSNSFTHTLQYKISGQNSYTNIVEKTSSISYNWTIPAGTYNYVSSSATSVTITINCITYNGNTQIGSKTTTLTAYTVESECKPTISVTYQLQNDGSALTGNNTTAILNWSNVKVSISATAKHGASISDYTIVHNGATYTGSSWLTFQKIQTTTFTCRATDSRGYVSSYTLTIPSISYFVPSITMQNVSPDTITNVAQVKCSGNVFTGSFGAANNSITVSYRYKQEGGSWSSWINLTTSTTTNKYTTNWGSDVLDYHNTYIYQARIVDSLNTKTTAEVTVRTLPLFDWDDQNFNFNIPILLSANSYGSTLPQSGVEGQIFIKI